MKFVTSLILFVALTGGFFIFCNLLIPVVPGSLKSIDFTVQKGEGAKDIISNLRQESLVRSNIVSRAFIISFGMSKKLQAGQYLFSPSMSTWSIIHKIATGDIATKKITIIEGWDLKEIGRYLEGQGICTEAEFTGFSAENFSSEFSFLKDSPNTANLEGYMFPDTYEFLPGTSAEDIIRLILDNFDKKLTPELRNEISRQKKSISQVITMASIIEKEVKKMGDKKIVSGILWERIDIGMPLQVDSTITYITNKNSTFVSYDDLAVDSPYNTYKNHGLPPGPISNPGIESITAAIYPTMTDYLYFLSKPFGETIFSRTFAEHSSAQATYLR